MQNQAFPNADTALIDMHPGSALSPTWTDARMGDQQIFNDPLSGILIQDIAETPTDATLAITVPNPPPVSPPGTTGGGGTGAAPPATGGATPTAPEPPTRRRTYRQAHQRPARCCWPGGIGRHVRHLRLPRPAQRTADREHELYCVCRQDSAAGGRAQVVYAVVAVDIAGVTSLPGSAAQLRAALLRALGASHLKAVHARSGKRRLVRVRGVVSDRRPSAGYASAAARGTPASLPERRIRGESAGQRQKARDALAARRVGRVKLQTLRVR